MNHIERLIYQRALAMDRVEEAILDKISRVAILQGVTRMVFTAHYHLLEKVDGNMVEDIQSPQIDELVKLYRKEVDSYGLEAEWEDGEWQ